MLSDRQRRAVRIKPDERVQMGRNDFHVIRKVADQDDTAEFCDQVDDNDFDRGFRIFRI